MLTVSKLIAWCYPFNTLEYDRWCRKRGLNMESTLKAAQNRGHDAEEEYYETFTDKTDAIDADYEVYFANNLYRGRADIVFYLEGEKCVADVKSWGSDKPYREPHKSKLQKANLQTALYAEALGCTRRFVIHVHPDQINWHEFKRKPTMYKEAIRYAKHISNKFQL